MTRKLVGTALLLMLGGCNFWYNEVPSPDDLMHVIPWFDHMILTKAVNPYQTDAVSRKTPIGAVPVGGGEAEWQEGNPNRTPFPQFGFNLAYATTVKHPATPAGPAARSGADLFQTYCAVCHGSAADGNGPVKIGAPSLLTARAVGLSDGVIYSLIRYGGGYQGGGNMPKYGDKIVRRDERWLVVDYLRELQRNAPVQPAGGK